MNNLKHRAKDTFQEKTKGIFKKEEEYKI